MGVGLWLWLWPWLASQKRFFNHPQKRFLNQCLGLESQSQTKLLRSIYIEFHVAMNFDKLTKNFEKFPNGPLIQGGFKVFFFCFFRSGVCLGPGAPGGTPQNEKNRKSKLAISKFN